MSTNGSQPIEDLRRGMDRLRARIFQLIEVAAVDETMGDKQAEAFKGLIRQATYDVQADLESALRGK